MKGLNDCDALVARPASPPSALLPRHRRGISFRESHLRKGQTKFGAVYAVQYLEGVRCPPSSAPLLATVVAARVARKGFRPPLVDILRVRIREDANTTTFNKFILLLLLNTTFSLSSYKGDNFSRRSPTGRGGGGAENTANASTVWYFK